MPLYNAPREHLKAMGITGKDATKLLRALGTLVDYEAAIGKALCEMPGGGRRQDLSAVCDALRYLVDG